ncbi:LOW QUALITY PROTEIN: spermatogenesis-associated protein 1 [Rhynchonycteris naso]
MPIEANEVSVGFDVSFDGQQTNNSVAKADEIIQRPVSVTLSKEEPEREPSFLENILKEFLNNLQEEGDFNWNGRVKEGIIVYISIRICKHILGLSGLMNMGSIKGEGRRYFKRKADGKNQFGNSELPRSLENLNNDCLSTPKRLLIKVDRRPGNTEIGKREYITLPDLNDFPSLICQAAVHSGITEISLLSDEREKIIKQMKQVREERRYLERTREEQMNVKELYEQNTLKQYHDHDSWKKYFKTKKVTASLEEILIKLQEDLELYYNLLMLLETQEVKMRPKNMANITDSKNYLVIQIAEVQLAVDQF